MLPPVPGPDGVERPYRVRRRANFTLSNSLHFPIQMSARTVARPSCRKQRGGSGEPQQASTPSPRGGGPSLGQRAASRSFTPCFQVLATRNRLARGSEDSLLTDRQNSSAG